MDQRALASAIDEESVIEPVVDASDILELRRQVDGVHVEEKIKDYIVDIVRATREPGQYGLDLVGQLDLGASPRGSMGLILASRALAILEGRNYVLPQDVKSLAPDVLRHRLMLSFEAQASGRSADDIVQIILSGLAVP
jgi:MoxR-like ATPase